jgi:protein FAM32A
MPASDYTSTVSGGLKLKGGPKDAGIKKKSKNKSKKPKPLADTDHDKLTPQTEDEGLSTEARDTTLSRGATPSEHPSTSSGTGKTEAQRRHEEIKRKRVSYKKKALYTRREYTLTPLKLDDRLKREGGAKTHKQRVEELNKYLSTLSEHHDMPRIGPG